MNTRLKVKMFGWLRAEAGETVITHFRTRKTSALFGYLAFHSDRSHPREFLADMLWPEARGSASRNSLSQALTSLRQEIGRAGENVSQLLHADRSTVQLHGDTDVAQFEEAVKAGSNRDERIAALTLATVVYRGEFLPSHYDDWILAERSRLRDLFLTANHELVSLLRQVGQPHAAVSLAHRAVREDPLSERAIRDLMQAHVDSREPQLALRAYHDLEVNLEREVGERPSSETRELARRIAAVSSASENSVVVSTPPPPAGTVTCLLVRFACPPHTAPAWTAALAAVRARIKNEFVRFGGAVLSDERAGIIATFADPTDALDCSVQLREELHRASWPDGVPVDGRMALSTFLDTVRHNGAEGCSRDVVRLALCAESSGAIVLAEATAALVRLNLEPSLTIVDGPLIGATRTYALRLDISTFESSRVVVGG
jgi:DNA-binding SARP family transcriptional activator